MANIFWIIKQIIRVTIFLSITVILSADSVAQPCYEVRKSRTHFNFKLLKKGVQIDTNKIRIDGVYIFSSPCQNEFYAILYKNKCYDSTYSFFRFFDNGRVFFSSSYCSFPKEEEVNRLDYGSYGYYKVEGDTLIIERHNSGGGGSFCYFDYHKIGDNSFKIFGTKHAEWRIFNTKIESAIFKIKHIFYPFTLNYVKTFW